MGVHVLVVDDDPAERRRIEDILKRQGHTVESAADGEAALERLARPDLPPISAMILDLVMPDLDGMAVLERLGRRTPAIAVIAQAGAGGIDAGASAMRAGAFDFLVKPAAPERVRASLANAIRVAALEDEILKLRLGHPDAPSLDDIAIRSPSMERVRQLAERAARSSIPVLIEGERGVGKEFLARAIHAAGGRRSRPFAFVNCTGADAGKVAGKLKEAAGGTLFLDEVGSLPQEVQLALTRMLAESGGEDAGRSHTLPGDVRLVAATKRRLVDLVSEASFREDLFLRLNVLPIWIPPLRERRGDIAALARRFLVRIAAEAGRTGVAGISAAATERLVGHDWPGNIRELEQTIFRAVILCERGELSVSDFPTIALTATAARARIDESEPGPHVAVADQEQSRREPAGGGSAPTDRRAFARYGLATLLDERGEMRPFEALEEEVIRFAIGHYSGHMSEVARRLGIGRSTLYRKIKDYGIAPEASVVS